MKRLDANPSRHSITPSAPANLEGLLQSLTLSDAPNQQLIESLKCLGDFHHRILEIADLLCDEQRRFEAENGQVRRELAELRLLVDHTRAQISAIPANPPVCFQELPPPIKPDNIAADPVADAYSNNIDQALDEAYKAECPAESAEPAPMTLHHTLSAAAIPLPEPPPQVPTPVVIRCGGGVRVKSLTAVVSGNTIRHDSFCHWSHLEGTRKQVRRWQEDFLEQDFEQVEETKTSAVDLIVETPIAVAELEIHVDETPIMVFDDSESDMIFDADDEAVEIELASIVESVELASIVESVEPAPIVASFEPTTALEPVDVAAIETIVDVVPQVETPAPEPKEEVQWMSHTRHDPPHRLPSAKFLKRGLSIPRDENDTRILQAVAETRAEPRPRRNPTLRKSEEQSQPTELDAAEVVPTPITLPTPEPVIVRDEAPLASTPTVEPKIRLRMPLNEASDNEAPRAPVRTGTPKFSALKRKLSPRPEFIVPARWWSITPIVLLTVALVAGLTIAGADHWRATMSLAALEETLDRQPASRRAISEALRGRYESPLARHDSRRDYLVARAMSELAGAPEDAESGQNAGERLMAARRNVERAIVRSPANVWYRLTLARFSDRLKLDPAVRTECWRWVQRIANPEPLYWRELAEHWIADGRPQQAIAAYRSALAKRPELTLQTLNRLTQSGIAVEDALRAVPASPIAIAAAARFLKDHGHADWKPYIEARMAEARSAGQPTADDLAADAFVCQILSQDDAAISTWQKAIAKAPGRREWQLSLAQLHYRREAYAESDRLAEGILRTDPAGPQANEARLLREKIELASGGKLRTAQLAAPTAN